MTPIDDSHSRIRPDSLVRIVSNYEWVHEEGGEGVHLYAVSAAVAPIPLPVDKFPEGVKTDPVDVLSVWMGRNYLNLMLTVKAHCIMMMEATRRLIASVPIVRYPYCSMPMKELIR